MRFAVEDANKSISLNRNFFKGYYRRAVTNMALGKFREALKDFEILKSSKPGECLWILISLILTNSYFN